MNFQKSPYKIQSRIIPPHLDEYTYLGLSQKMVHNEFIKELYTIVAELGICLASKSTPWWPHAPYFSHDGWINDVPSITYVFKRCKWFQEQLVEKGGLGEPNFFSYYSLILQDPFSTSEFDEDWKLYYYGFFFFKSSTKESMARLIICVIIWSKQTRNNASEYVAIDPSFFNTWKP